MQMFIILSRLFLESLRMYEEKTKRFIRGIRKRQPFCFLAKSAITYLRVYVCACVCLLRCVVCVCVCVCVFT